MPSGSGGGAFYLIHLRQRESVNLEGATGEHDPTWLWPAGPDGFWAGKGRWADWQLGLEE
jgi:hypothetical protein